MIFDFPFSNASYFAKFLTFSTLSQKFPIGQRLATSIEREKKLEENGLFNKNTYS
jgi:hypothetical protein